MDNNAWFNRAANLYETVNEYDAAQKDLPKALRDSWWEQKVARRIIAFRQYVEKHEETWTDDFIEIFAHSIPKMLFISIPFFALLLYLLYIRSRKNYYYVTHGIFTIHLYCAIFLLLVLQLPFDYLNSRTGDIISAVFVFIFPAIYLFLAMRRFYKQGLAKTILKFILLLASSGFIFFILLAVFFVNALLALSGGVH
ncbi:MAG TPA: hypothetical protein PL009_08780 [Flavipsychrobacter sp.]|nr:hypothetical protein [Flavipsychrobacter sp.]